MASSEPPLGHAIRVALDAHGAQVRKDGFTPYVCHPIAVMRSLAQLGVRDPSVLCAAVLHDTFEDTELTAHHLHQLGSSERCVSIVAELTKAPGQSRKDYTTSFANASEEARLVKLADRLDNLTDPSWAIEAYYWQDSLALLTAIEKNGFKNPEFAPAAQVLTDRLRSAIAEGYA